MHTAKQKWTDTENKLVVISEERKVGEDRYGIKIQTTMYKRDRQQDILNIIQHRELEPLFYNNF